MVDYDGNLEDIDIEFIQTAIQNNGLNVSNSINKLTEQLELANALKIMELTGERKPILKSGGLEKASKIIYEYFEGK